MLTNLIENRGKEFSNLLKIGDYLGRSLRECVELFTVEKGKVTYLTESGKIVTGSYSFNPHLKLSNIQVEDAKVLENEEAFNKAANNKVSSLMANLLESDYQEAESTFDDILDLFQTKLSFGRIKEKLTEKTERYGNKTKIVSSPEYKKVNEVKDKIIEFLKENEKITNIPEIKNGIKLASVVSKAFNLPRLTLEQLAKDKVYSIKTPEKNTIYEHLCRQELIAKELLEAKESFDTVWANNELISDIASLIFEKDNKLVEEKVAEIIAKIPYFALATKKQLSSVISNSLNLSEITVSNTDLIDYVHKIFEMKKPVKTFVLKLLNEKYGVNINHLTEVPTFSNLLKTNAVIFSSLARLSPKNSVIKEVLNNFAKSLDEKNGVEAIDVVDFLNEIFSKAGYKSVINETSLMTYFDFNQVADDLSKIGTVLKLLRPAMGLGGGALGGAMGGMPQATPTPPITNPLPQPNPMAAGDPMQTDTPNAADQAAAEVQAGDPNAQGDIDQEAAPGQDPTVPNGNPAVGGDPMAMAQGGDVQDPVNIANSTDIANIVAQIEDLLAGLTGQTGDPSMDQPIPGQTEDEFDFQGGEGNQQDDIEGDGDSDGAPNPNAEKGDFDSDGEAEGNGEGKPEFKKEKKGNPSKESKGKPEKKDSKKPQKPPVKK